LAYIIDGKPDRPVSRLTVGYVQLGTRIVSAVRGFSPPEAHLPLHGDGSAVARSIRLVGGV